VSLLPSFLSASWFIDRRLSSPRPRPAARPQRFSLNSVLDVIEGVSPSAHASSREVPPVSRRRASTDTIEQRPASQPFPQAPSPNMDAYGCLQVHGHMNSLFIYCSVVVAQFWVFCSVC
jgi:hypothetical protein